MTDVRLRELERRWREGRELADEAALLRERVRAALLTEERLRLAAYCGHEGACQATSFVQQPVDNWTWAHGIPRWGLGPCLVAALAAGQVLVGHSEPRHVAVDRVLEAFAECARTESLTTEACHALDALAAAVRLEVFPDLGEPGAVEAFRQRLAGEELSRAVERVFGPFLQPGGLGSTMSGVAWVLRSRPDAMPATRAALIAHALAVPVADVPAPVMR